MTGTKGKDPLRGRWLDKGDNKVCKIRPWRFSLTAAIHEEFP